MINFFRRIRQTLITDGKLNRYFVYAIGEILLVVAGILIALQINNWNNKEIASRQEVVLLEEMKLNLENDIADIRVNIISSNNLQTSNQIILDNLIPTNSFNDSLSKHYASIYGTTGFSKNTSAYKNLESLGFNIVSNDLLRIEITNLYTTLYNNIANTQDIHAFFIQNHLFSQIMENIKIDTFNKQAHPVDHASLVKNHEFKEILNYNCVYLKHMTTVYIRAEESITSLIRLIEEEIHERTDV